MRRGYSSTTGKNTTGRTHCSHRWMYNDDPDKTGKNGSMHFHGPAFYSYGTVIAVKYPAKKTVIMAGEGIWNSSSTSGHKGWVRSAIPDDWKVVVVDVDSQNNRYAECLRDIKGIRECHDGMLCSMKERLEAVASARRGRSRELKWEAYEHYLDKCNEVAAFLGRKPTGKIVLDEELMTAIKEGIAQAEARERAKEKREEKAREAAAKKRMEEERANVALWRTRAYHGSTYGFEETYLRFSENGKFVETSRGAVVGIKDALRLFKLCERIRNDAPAGPWVSDKEILVENYRLNYITPDGNARVGCHTLAFAEMEWCFKQAVASGYIKG